MQENFLKILYSVFTAHPNTFEKDRLINELSYISGDDQCRDADVETTFEIIHSEFRTFLPKLDLLLCLIFTVPAISISVGKNFHV